MLYFDIQPRIDASVSFAIWAAFMLVFVPVVLWAWRHGTCHRGAR